MIVEPDAEPLPLLPPAPAPPQEVAKYYGVEWDRVLCTTLGVANKRLYSLRLQTPFAKYDTRAELLARVAGSFVVREVETE